MATKRKMKPARAWALVHVSGEPVVNHHGIVMLFMTLLDAPPKRMDERVRRVEIREVRPRGKRGN